MIAVKQMELRSNMRKYFDRAADGEVVIVPRKKNKNVVVISEAAYNELQDKHNARYTQKLDRSLEQLERGETISFTMDELSEMESGDWKPTQKVLDWIQKVSQKDE